MVGVRSSKVNMRSEMVAAAVAVLMMMAAVAVAVVARPVKLKDNTCSTADEYVYPYASACSSPAELGREYHYTYEGTSTFVLGGMEPEYDESNSTYYVRFTGDSSNAGAKYMALQLISASKTLLVNSTFYIQNVDTSRVLQWRLEGVNEFFLIEKEAYNFLDGAPFRLVQAKDVTPLCPTTDYQCQAYFLVSDIATPYYTGAGLLAYQEDNVTYIKAANASSTGDLPIVLSDTTIDLSSALPFPTTIRTVTQ